MDSKTVALCCVFASLMVFVFADKSESEKVAGNRVDREDTSSIEISADAFKKLMWKKCSNSSYVICAKLALVHVIEKLDSSESYILLPGVSLQKGNVGEAALNREEVVVRRDFNEAVDKYLLTKIKTYLGSLTLHVKLLDKNIIDDTKAFGDVLTDSSQNEGRGKKKYMHSLLMAGWMSGATLLALTMKTIAILSGKALLAALLSLMLSVITAFSHKGHAETKSTTYEIITKPIVAHTHVADVHDAHPSELSSAYTYKRSITPEVIIKNADIPEDIEHIFRKIKDQTPYFTPVSIEYPKS